MGLGDGSMKFGFSRMGMGLDEQQLAESKWRGQQEAAKGFRAQERMGRRAFRDLQRKGDYVGAYKMMDTMAKGGFGTTGNYQAGEAERMMSDRLGRKLGNLTRGTAGNPATPGLDSNPANPATGGADMQKKVSALQNGVTTNTTTGATVQPLGTGPLSKSVMNPQSDSLESFSSDLGRSSLIGKGDPSAQKAALDRGMKLGLSQEEVGAIGGFDARGASTYTDNPFAGAKAVDPTTGMTDRARALMKSMTSNMGLSGDAANSWIGSMREKGASQTQSILNPMRDAAATDYNSNVQPRNLELQDQLAQVQSRSDSLYSQIKGNALGLQNREAARNEEISALAGKQAKQQASRKEDAEFYGNLENDKKKRQIKEGISNRKPSSLVSSIFDGIDLMRRFDSSKKF